jgi:hypothetical protein
MSPGRLRQLLDLPRAVGQEVGNAELRRDVDVQACGQGSRSTH